MREPRSNRLYFPRVLSIEWHQRHAPRRQHASRVSLLGQRHHRRRQAFVASRHADHAASRRQRTDQPPHHHRCIVTEGQGIEHSRGPLRPSIARIRAGASKRHGAQAFSALRPPPPPATQLPNALCDTQAPPVLSPACPVTIADPIPCRHSASTRKCRRTAALTSPPR